MASVYKIKFLVLVIGILMYMSNQVAADSHSEVKFLPGFKGPLPFHLQTGYVGVDESEDVQLFYYFVKSQRNPKQDPLILWMTGGPGCSSFTALVYEIGPINFEKVKYNGTLPTLILNPNAWTKIASIIFLDLPVGTGFSYGRTPSASGSTDSQASAQAVQFLRKWLADHSDFLSNPFYVGGDSYAGIFVPIITQMISNGNEAGLEPSINLKGYLAGNPLTFPAESNFQIPFSHGMGLISDELYESLRRSCSLDDQKADSNSVECSQSLEAFKKLTDGINQQQILENNCGRDSPQLRRSLSDGKRAVTVGFGDTPLDLLPALKCRVFGLCSWNQRYIGVDESEDVQLFYYFIESERNPKEDPLILWMTGGPGCSSFSALANEIGPLYFKEEMYNGTLPTLLLNPNTWTKSCLMHLLSANWPNSHVQILGIACFYASLEKAYSTGIQLSQETFFFPSLHFTMLTLNGNAHCL